MELSMESELERRLQATMRRVVQTAATLARAGDVRALRRIEQLLNLAREVSRISAAGVDSELLADVERALEKQRRALGRTLVIRMPERPVLPGTLLLSTHPEAARVYGAKEPGRGAPPNLNLLEIHMSDETYDLPEGNTLSAYMKCVEILAGGHDVRGDEGQDASPAWWDAFNRTKQRWPEQQDLMGDIGKQNAAWAREQQDWPSDQP
jgi:hypothetical protein